MERKEPQKAVGRVIGTRDSTPLTFWVGLTPGQVLQLDDVIATERSFDGRDPVRIYGIVANVIARHEGAHFDSDVFLIEDGLLPAEVCEAAEVIATRIEPEFYVPPIPGTEVRIARDKERDEALFFDEMDHKLPAGLSRDEEPVFINLEFIDGTRGAHVNISGISGVATKTSYATFLLHSLFASKALKGEAINTKALVFNVKGEDLMFLDHANIRLDDEDKTKYAKLELPATPFRNVTFYAPPKPGTDTGAPDVATRGQGVTSFFWTLEEFCREELLPFLFADAEDDRQQYTLVVSNVTAKLRQAVPLGDGGVKVEDVECRTFRDLVDLVTDRVEDEHARFEWAGRSIGQGTVNAFVRRLWGSVKHVERLVRADIPNPENHRIERDKQVTVVDIHNLNDRAKRFVVGVVLRKTFDEKERAGQARPLLFILLDELNKYAPREGSSPIKEILLDVAERGRSLGIILIGAQQTASEVERRIISNSAIRVVGRLDSSEVTRDEYGFLPAAQRDRAKIMKPGTMILSQPELPVPLVTQFPFPAWATRWSEAGTNPASNQPSDPFDGLPQS